jgi:hypothetical protein
VKVIDVSLELTYRRFPMSSQVKLGTYYRSFFKISKFLMSKKKLAEQERNWMFLDGLPTDINAKIRHWLSILLVDNHPDKPYDFNAIYKAAIFLLPGNTSAVTPVAAHPVLQNNYPPRAQVVPSPQAPLGVVVKREFMAREPPGPCHFCGGTDHYQRFCGVKLDYIRDGKIIESQEQVYMPEGSSIPGWREHSTFKKCVDRFAQSSLATNANTTVIAGLYCCAQPQIQVEEDVDTSAYLHTWMPEEEEDKDDEELQMLQQAVYEACQAFANTCAEWSTRKTESKSKNVCFDGVQVPAPSRAGLPFPAPGTDLRVLITLPIYKKTLKICYISI